MLKLFLQQIKKRIPIITIILILECLISTIPQLFLPNLYSDISGRFPTLHNFYMIALPAFTHTPKVLIEHMTGNILVILIFGGITEIVIGSSRFAFISLLTLSSTTVMDYVLYGTNAGHGASGICWGYQMFFIFILAILYKKIGRNLFKDIFVIISLLMLIFLLFVLQILQTLILKQGFEFLHLVSIAIVLPFIFLWRNDIKNNVLQIIEHKKIETKNSIKSVFVILVLVVAIVNTYAVSRLIFITQRHSKNVIASVSPSIGTDIRDIQKHVIVKFRYPMKVNSEKLEQKSITYYNTKKAPEVNTKWINDRTMRITFSRKFTKKENFQLGYSVKMPVEDIMQDEEVQISLEYK